jgi:hypothetical protein
MRRRPAAAATPPFEHARLFMSRVYYSRAYSCFYVLMVLLNAGLLVALAVLHLVHDKKFPRTLVGLEVCVTSILALEVAGRMCSQGRSAFCRSWCNVLDAIVVALCLLSVVVFVAIPTVTDLEEAMAQVLIICRYSMHFVRVLMLLKMTQLQHQRRGRRGSDWEVKFAPVGDDESDVGMVAEIINISADFSDGFSDDEEDVGGARREMMMSNHGISSSLAVEGEMGVVRGGPKSGSGTLFDRYASLIIDPQHREQSSRDHQPYRDESPRHAAPIIGKGSAFEDGEDRQCRRNSIIATVATVQDHPAADM